MTNRWRNSGNCARLYFLGLQNNCRGWLHPWNKKMLTPWKKVMTNLDSVLKTDIITFLTKVCIVKTIVSLVVMYGCESWTIKKAECQKIHAFKLWCWKRPLRVPWPARRSNQSIRKKISPEYSLEELMWSWSSNTFGYLKWSTDSMEKVLIEGRGEGDDRG